MGFFASVDGLITPAHEARVSVLDNGFTFGDAVYETLRTYGGRPFALARHLRRLRASAARLGIEIPLADGDLTARLDALLARAENAESYIRFVVSRGVGDISYHSERVQGPTIVMVVKPYEQPPASWRIEGVRVSMVDVRRNHPAALDPAIKSCNLLNNILAMRAAQTAGAIEAILLNDRGEIAEGAGSNVFVVRGGQVLTPPLGAGILAGITREVLLELAPAIGVTIHEAPLRPNDLLDAEEAFLTSTLKELAPITRVDDRAIGDGQPGPVTLKLMDAFQSHAPSEAL